MLKTTLSTLLIGCCVATSPLYANSALNNSLGTFEPLQHNNIKQLALNPTSRAVYQSQHGYTVFIGYISSNGPWFSDGALREFTYPNKKSTPTIDAISLPNINNGISSSQPQLVMASVSNNTLYVAESEGKNNNSASDNAGRYALAQASIDQNGIPGKLAVVAQTGEHGLPAQLTNGSDSTQYGYVFWYGLIDKKPTVIFTNKAKDSDKAVFMVYQLQAETWQETGSFSADYDYYGSTGGLLGITSPPQVITSDKEGTKLLFSAYKTTTEQELLALSFSEDGTPESGNIQKITLPPQPHGDDFYSAYYEHHNKTLYVSMQKQGVYQAAFTVQTMQPSWQLVPGSTSCDPSENNTGKSILSAAPMLGNPGEGLNVIVQTDVAQFDVYQLQNGTCKPYDPSYAYLPGTLFNVGNQHYWTVDGDIYMYRPASSK